MYLRRTPPEVLLRALASFTTSLKVALSGRKLRIGVIGERNLHLCRFLRQDRLSQKLQCFLLIDKASMCSNRQQNQWVRVETPTFLALSKKEPYRFQFWPRNFVYIDEEQKASCFAAAATGRGKESLPCYG